MINCQTFFVLRIAFLFLRNPGPPRRDGVLCVRAREPVLQRAGAAHPSAHGPAGQALLLLPVRLQVLHPERTCHASSQALAGDALRLQRLHKRVSPVRVQPLFLMFTGAKHCLGLPDWPFHKFFKASKSGDW